MNETVKRKLQRLRRERAPLVRIGRELAKQIAEAQARQEERAKREERTRRADSGRRRGSLR
jgi:hypothetical protein